MSGLSVIIPSKTASNLIPCVEAIRAAMESTRIIVVDDGLDLAGVDMLDDQTWSDEEFSRKANAFVIPGQKPFIFARNVNLGIKAAGEDDVILLNDDALLQTPGGFTAIQRAAQEHPEYGIISATTNVTGNTDQYPQGIGLRDAGIRSVAFICVLIPRRTIELVGFMDERFGGITADGRRIYGFCDNDYARRTREAGLKVGIFDGCFVDHGSLQSSFRGDPRAAGDISAAAEIYRAKWGNLD